MGQDGRCPPVQQSGRSAATRLVQETLPNPPTRAWISKIAAGVKRARDMSALKSVCCVDGGSTVKTGDWRLELQFKFKATLINNFIHIYPVTL